MIRLSAYVIAAAALVGLAGAAEAQLEPSPRPYNPLAPFCPGGAPTAHPLSAQIAAMQTCDPRQLFMLPRDGSAPQIILIGDGPMTEVHVPLLRRCTEAGIPTAVYRGAGGVDRGAYGLDVAALGQRCANRQSLIVNYEAVRWFAREYPNCQVINVGDRPPGVLPPASSTGVNWTGMERCTLSRCGLPTANPTWCGMEYGARPPITYVPLGPGPTAPVGPPAETWCGMEYGAPRPSTYLPPSCPPPGRFNQFMTGCRDRLGNCNPGGLDQMGAGGTCMMIGGGLTLDGLNRCTDEANPNNQNWGIVETTGGTYVAVTGGGMLITGTGTLVGSGTLVTAGGTVMTAAPPVAACALVATTAYVGTRQVDNCTGGRISGGIAVGGCAVGDFFANVCYRCWTSDGGNWDLTRTMAEDCGRGWNADGSPQCTIRGPAPRCGAGNVRPPNVNPPYEASDSLGCATGSSSGEAAWLLMIGVGALVLRRRRRG